MKIIDNDASRKQLANNAAKQQMEVVNKITNGLPLEKVTGITRFVKNLVKLQREGQETINSDDLLNLASRCFGSKVKNYNWTVETAVSNICDLLEIPEEKRILIDNLISMYTE